MAGFRQALLSDFQNNKEMPDTLLAAAHFNCGL
jgi:hypothetical protein